jgi:ribonuclease P protein component
MNAPAKPASSMERLKRRAAFKAVAAGKRITRSGFVLQALARETPVPGMRENRPRFGFTVTKKIGNAVVRNRIRRRLREAVKRAATNAAPTTDYVVVARPAALTLQFERLVTDLTSGFELLSRQGSK